MYNIKNVALIGMGALGILFGDKLVSYLGHDNVDFIADSSRAKRYQSYGVSCNGKPCVFNVLACDENNKKYDLIIFCVKATQLDEAITEASNHIDDKTIIISILNGISSEEILSSHFGSSNILYSVAQGMDAVKLGNALTYSHAGKICIGYPESEPEKSLLLESVISLFDKADIAYTVEKDILHRIWSKWMLNVGVNQVCMVSEGNYSVIQKPGTYRDMMIASMKEVKELAAFEGITLTDDDLDGYVDLMDTLLPDGCPSMRQDGISHRKSEVEFFAGTVIKKAKTHHMLVPINDYLYKTIKEMESRY